MSPVDDCVVADTQTLHDRMKVYESVHVEKLNPDLPWVIRVDGKAFHTWTKSLERPFAPKFVSAMNKAACQLTATVQGAVFAYVQSDEITVVVPARANQLEEMWFGGKVAKITTIAASCCASMLTLASRDIFGDDVGRLTMFDARAFNLPSADEVINCLVWRQQDAIRNSIFAVGRTKFSHKQLHRVSGQKLREMLSTTDSAWETFDTGLQQGRLITRSTYNGASSCVRHRWSSNAAPKFVDKRIEMLALLTRHASNVV